MVWVGHSGQRGDAAPAFGQAWGLSALSWGHAEELATGCMEAQKDQKMPGRTRQAGFETKRSPTHLPLGGEEAGGGPLWGVAFPTHVRIVLSKKPATLHLIAAGRVGPEGGVPSWPPQWRK